jgi:hypothetical protein
MSIGPEIQSTLPIKKASLSLQNRLLIIHSEEPATLTVLQDISQVLHQFIIPMKLYSKIDVFMITVRIGIQMTSLETTMLKSVLHARTIKMLNTTSDCTQTKYTQKWKYMESIKLLHLRCEQTTHAK